MSGGALLSAVLVAAGDHLGELSRLSTLEKVIVALAVLLTVWSIWRSVRLTLHPGEEAPDHPKRMIFQDDPQPPGPRASLGRNGTEAR